MLSKDAFESGSLLPDPATWSALSANAEHLAVVPEAAYWGVNGLEVTVGDSTDHYVRDDTPEAESQYRARFYLDPNDVTLTSTDIFAGYSNQVTGSPVFRVQVQQTGGTTQVRLGALSGTDPGTWVYSPAWYDLVGDWNAIEIEYTTGPGTGTMSLWVGGELKATITGLDNAGSTVDSVCLGVMNVSGGTSGTLHFDDYDSRRFSAPGLLADPGDHNPGPLLYTYTSQPDGTVGVDAEMNSRFPTANYGGSASFHVGEDASNVETVRGLIQFDLTGIPANAVVLDATLTLTVTSRSGSSARTICVYRLTQDWVEDQATWNVYATGNNWPGGSGAAGDYYSSVSTCADMAGNEAAGTAKSWSFSAPALQILQSMINGSVINKGFLLKATQELNTAFAFASSDNTTIEYRPVLEIEYTTADAPTGWKNKAYTYSQDKPHAVTSLSTGESYSYDENGNMTCRVEDGKAYNQVYNAENRLYFVQLLDPGVNCPAANVVATSGVTASWKFFYDGDGNRVKQYYFEGSYGEDVTIMVTTYFAGGAYELDQTGTVQDDEIYISATTTRRYYAFGGQSIAMAECTGGTCTGPTYFLTDHLGSVIMALDEGGNEIAGSEQRYLPFGEVRSDFTTSTITDAGYTFQKNLDGQGNFYKLGLMDYRARFYSNSLGRFLSPDTIVPNPADTQAFNRYSYTI